MLKLLLVGGGTAGHINPALAIANEVKTREKEVQILFAGTPNGMEKELVQKAGYDFAPIQVSGFRRSFSPENLKHNARAVLHLMKAGGAAKQLMARYRPDLVIGTGGYVSGPVVRAAAKRGIKTMIHEQNAFPGVTNKLLARSADCVLLAVEEAKKHFAASVHYAVVGNPIRAEILTQSRKEARQALGIPEGMVCVLSFGGSLGARIINQAAADLIAWNQKHHKIFHIHGYGRMGKQHFPAMLKERGLSLEQLSTKSQAQLLLLEYLDEMPRYLAAADLVICRSGAMTLSELQACGKASILIPSPYVAENHRYHNAMVLKQHGAAALIVEQEYDRKLFLQTVETMLADPQTLAQFGKNASKLAVLDTTERIYHLMKRVLVDAL